MSTFIDIACLSDKAHELRQAIISYEEHLDRTRKELAVVTATLSIFERDTGWITDKRPAHVRNLFKRGEVLTICKASLSTEPAGMATRELAVARLAAHEFDHEDPVLIRAMVGLLAPKKGVRRQEIVKVGKERKPVWRLASIRLGC